MTELLTAAQMRAIEQVAIDAGEVTGLELMERAGRGVVEAVFEEWPELAKTSHRAVVLCGPGNNGGDGFVVARLLKEWGWEVEVFLYGDPENLPPDARVNYKRWADLGQTIPFSNFDAHDFVSSSVEDAGRTWIIDALFGTGLKRPIAGDLAEKLRPLCDMPLGQRPGIFSVDIPSGVCSDSGKTLGLSLPSEMTITFHTAKAGHYLSQYDGTGKLCVVDIGLKRQWRRPLEKVKVLGLGEYGFIDWVSCGKDRSPKNDPVTHKFSHGHAFVLSGGSGQTGAARLAARGALRVGAGLVTLAVPEAARMEVASQVTAVMLRQAETPDEVARVLEDSRINAVCLGPGLGLERARGLVEGVLSEAEPRATVLDADALSVFADDPDALFERLHERCVMTPHGGEFARLFPDIAERLNAVPVKGPAYSKVDATREAAKRAGCVVLFKGPDTVIAHPDGRCSINSARYDRATPWLATAGSGDVLAGFVTGLMARGFDAMQAAETGSWLHVECARTFGPGLIAEDLPEQLPAVFRALDV